MTLENFIKIDDFVFILFNLRLLIKLTFRSVLQWQIIL